MLTFRLNEIQRFIIIITIDGNAGIFSATKFQKFLLTSLPCFFSGNYFTTGLLGESRDFYPCDTCNRSYRRLITLQRHKKLECGKEATFSCVLCNSRFKHKHSLQRHFKVHIPTSTTATMPVMPRSPTDPRGIDDTRRMYNYT